MLDKRRQLLWLRSALLQTKRKKYFTYCANFIKISMEIK